MLAEPVPDQPWLFTVMGSSGKLALRSGLKPLLSTQVAADDTTVDTGGEIAGLTRRINHDEKTA